MDRTKPASSNEEIELYMRTYYSLLRSSSEIEVRSLEETHSAMNASLHQKASQVEIDWEAFVYCALRMPVEIAQTRLILLGQSAEVFARRSYPELAAWTSVKSVARRRKCFFDGSGAMAVFINSASDIDDFIPMLTAYQIEWNKMHLQLNRAGLTGKTEAEAQDYFQVLALDGTDLESLNQVWGEQCLWFLQQVAQGPKRFAIRLLAGSLNDYRRAAQAWWQSILEQCPVKDIASRPVYFLSSNMHALPNLLLHYARLIQDELLAYLQENNPENLYQVYQNLGLNSPLGIQENILNYIMRMYFRTATGYHHYDLRLAQEIKQGIHNVRRPRNLDIGVQIIELAKLDSTFFDRRIQNLVLDWDKLQQSHALIVNVDYPLGLGAYQVLSHIAANVGELKGVYIMGKAATLNGRVGDVMVPGVVHDEHSQNTYLFRNCFTAQHIAPFLNYGTVFDNQKALTAKGTLLQNRQFMHVFYKEGYTDLEMEAGPYLSAMYENIYPTRYPVDEIVNLFLNQPYDIGILHYASDTPYSQRQNLLSKSMLYFGMEATYAAASAIMRRILTVEIENER